MDNRMNAQMEDTIKTKVAAENLKANINDDIDNLTEAERTGKVNIKRKSTIFIKDKGITAKHITFLGKRYTYKQFEYMLKYMYRGVFMYPDKLVKPNPNPNLKEDPITINGFVIVRGFVFVNNDTDKLFVHATDNYKTTYDTITGNYGKHIDNANLRMFGNTFRDSISRLLSLKANGRIITDPINKKFQDFEDHYFCDSCGIFANTKKLIRTEKDGRKLEFQACPTCVKKLVINHQRKVDKVGRNDICACGSGKKYKHCCITKQS